MTPLAKHPPAVSRLYVRALIRSHPTYLVRQAAAGSLSAIRLSRGTHGPLFSVASSPRPRHGLYYPVFQYSCSFRSMPMLRSAPSRNSQTSKAGDIVYIELPMPADVKLPTLPEGWERVPPKLVQQLEDSFRPVGFRFFPIEKVWLYCYVGLPSASALTLKRMTMGEKVTIPEILKSLTHASRQESGAGKDYLRHPVIVDITDNQRYSEWRHLSTTQRVPMFCVPSSSKQAPSAESAFDQISGEADSEQKQLSQAQKNVEQGKDGKKEVTSEAKASPKQAEKPDPGPQLQTRSSTVAKDQDVKHGSESKGKSGTDAGKTPKRSDQNDRNRWLELVLYGATIGLVWAMMDTMSGSQSEREITWQELRKNFLDKGLVERLVVFGSRVRVDLNLNATRSMYPESLATNPYFHYYFTIGSVDAFERKLDIAQDELGIPPSERIPVTYREPTSGFWGSLVVNWGGTLLFIGLLYWMSRSTRGGGAGGFMNFGKSRAKRFSHESSVKVKFADVAGADEAKVEIMEFVSFLKSPDRFQRLGAKIPRGAILSGPPGTGKTLLAKATAGESDVPFFSVSGSEFVEMFVGVGASRVRDLFQTARKNAPCIIFIDEIDAIGKKRTDRTGIGGNEEREATLNQILTEMDGFNTSEQVVVLAGTNRPDTLDKALTRPGRFDRQIVIDRPTMKGRADIFRVYLKKIVTNEDMENLCGRLSALTPGFAGADIANAVNEAALIAARANAETVGMAHFEQAIERVIAGLERKSLVLSKDEKRTVAYHEAGHAICGWYFEHADPLLKVSIIPRGQGALGYAQYLPSGDAYLMTVNQLMDRMAMTLGGRVSEEIHFPSVTTGASDDFKKVTQMATTMVTQWGMSEKLGPLHFHNDQQQLQKPFAEATAQTIDLEVRRIVDEAYKQCKELLMSRKKEIGLVAEELLRKEVLTREDLVRLLGPRKWADKEEFSKYFYGEMGGKHAPPPFPAENTDNPGDTAQTAFKHRD